MRQTCHLLYRGYMFRPFVGSSSGLLWNQVSESCVHVGIPTVFTNSRNTTCLTVELHKADVIVWNLTGKTKPIFIYLFSRLFDVSTSSCAHLTIILSFSSICLCPSSLLPLIPFLPSAL